MTDGWAQKFQDHRLTWFLTSCCLSCSLSLSCTFLILYTSICLWVFFCTWLCLFYYLYVTFTQSLNLTWPEFSQKITLSVSFSPNTAMTLKLHQVHPNLYHAAKFERKGKDNVEFCKVPKLVSDLPWIQMTVTKTIYTCHQISVWMIHSWIITQFEHDVIKMYTVLLRKYTSV